MRCVASTRAYLSLGAWPLALAVPAVCPSLMWLSTLRIAGPAQVGAAPSIPGRPPAGVCDGRGGPPGLMWMKMAKRSRAISSKHFIPSALPTTKHSTICPSAQAFGGALPGQDPFGTLAYARLPVGLEQQPCPHKAVCSPQDLLQNPHAACSSDAWALRTFWVRACHISLPLTTHGLWVSFQDKKKKTWKGGHPIP